MIPSSLASGVYSSMEHLLPDIPSALKVCGYVIAAGLIVQSGVLTTKAIVLGTLAYGVYATTQKVSRAYSAPSPKLASGTHVQITVMTQPQG